MNQKIKGFIIERIWMIRKILHIYNHIPFNNSIRILKENSLSLNGMLKKCNIRVTGMGNHIECDDLSRLVNTKISIVGNNNTLHIEERAYLENIDICIEDDGGEIQIGAFTVIFGKSHLACIEGTKIDIGKNCLFSANITIRTGDSHSLVDTNTGKRINPSKDVKIGNHVWVGNGATILKGIEIPEDCVVGACAVVTHTPQEGNCVLAGNPAKVVKTGVVWAAQRLKM